MGHLDLLEKKNTLRTHQLPIVCGLVEWFQTNSDWRFRQQCDSLGSWKRWIQSVLIAWCWCDLGLIFERRLKSVFHGCQGFFYCKLGYLKIWDITK